MTFTDPEIGSVGLSEKRARDQVANVRTVSLKVEETARGEINGEPNGIIKLIADNDRRVLVGALCVGPRSGEILAELTLAIRAEIPFETLADTLHAFPTFSRALDGLVAQLAR